MLTTHTHTKIHNISTPISKSKPVFRDYKQITLFVFGAKHNSRSYRVVKNLTRKLCRVGILLYCSLFMQ